jgi:hypothetical protein
MVLIALIGGTAQVHDSRTAVSGGLGHISMDFALGTSVLGIPNGLFHALLILSLTMLPYLIWQLQKLTRFSINRETFVIFLATWVRVSP